MKRCARTALAANLPENQSAGRSRLCVDWAAARTPKHSKELELSDTTLFFQAIQAGEASKVKALLDSNPSLASVKSERGQSGVLLAAYSGRKEISELLLAREVTLELHEAAAAGQLERVQHLVEKDPALAKSYSPDGFPVFALAAVFGHRDVAEYLFAKGAEVNAAATNGTGYNPRTGAVAGGHTSLVASGLGKRGGHKYRHSAGY